MAVTAGVLVRTGRFVGTAAVAGAGGPHQGHLPSGRRAPRLLWCRRPAAPHTSRPVLPTKTSVLVQSRYGVSILLKNEGTVSVELLIKYSLLYSWGR